MSKTFFVNKENKQLGPFPLHEILDLIAQKKVSWMDFIYDDIKKDWIHIMEHKLFHQYFEESILKKKAVAEPLPTSGKEKSMSTENHGDVKNQIKDKIWFVLKDDKNYGPFSLFEIIQMLQTKILFEYDFVWQSKMDGWKRVAEVPDFSKESIMTLMKSGNPAVMEYFFRRKNLRVNYNCSLVIHDNKQIYKGRSLEISSGGAGVVIDSDHFKPGQNLFFHFQPGDGVPPFNAIGTIVSKQFMQDKINEIANDIRYGVKFSSISQNVKQKIQEFAEGEKNKKKKAS
ncbi:MAG: DUF4339 domain-containing protein [Bdellovibrionaceae bacterium]|nr:DUF4339 domain-containing protein [Pseudobdellovibrionaceae bacterium]